MGKGGRPLGSKSHDATPWRTYQAKHPGMIPDDTTLTKWRKKAWKLAKSIGAIGACDLCKRPIKARYGWIWLRTPLAWRSRPMKRKICYSCFLTLQTTLQLMEANGARDHLPPEEFQHDEQDTVTDDVDGADEEADLEAIL